MGGLGNMFGSFDISVFRLPSIGVNTVIEILIMTYFFYKFFKWIQRTTAWSLFRGILLIFGVSVIAYFFKLSTLSWIINNAFSVGIIAIIIIVQPELRSALDRLGKNQITRLIAPMGVSQDEKMTAGTIKAVIDAATAMSKDNTGAFIVLEKKVSLSEYAATGAELDARVTSQLLINIFVDKTPLHDGAVIIRDNRISAASCIMPLTKKEIGAEYGTRHRAAVGTSEISDADVIIVSEETGKISLAKEGQLYKNLSGSELEKALTDGVSPSKRRIIWEGWGHERNS